MPKICYSRDSLRKLEKNEERMKIIKQANAIIATYQAQGFDLTLRQLYYQFVARDLLPNKQSEYKRLGEVLLEGRMAGLVDWLAIIDRTRNLADLSHWDDPAQIVQAVSEQFRIDLWATQPNRVEVWVEKDAAIGVVMGVCQQLDVPYFSCRGNTSASEMWVGSQRFKKHKTKRQETIILHFGDHDPSGVDMTRDIRDRLATFGTPVDVRRLALNMDQVEQYGPPPNPAKESDSRYKGYAELYGDESWELDALEPAVLAALIRQEVLSIREERAWQKALREQKEGRAELRAISENYEEVKEHVTGNGWVEPVDEDESEEGDE
jgi:hypothetical protein